MCHATLRLFNAIQTEDKTRTLPQASVWTRMLRNGYIVDPTISTTEMMLDTIEEVVGISGEKANASFHKSWGVIKDSPMEQLVIQQIIHYITTYGFEALGIYSQSSIYIPQEVLELPSSEGLNFVVIKALTAQEILEGILRLGSGVALSQQTLDDVMTIVKANRYDSSFVQKIANRELRASLEDFYGIVPTEPEAFLRYLVYKLTGETLLIKNRYLIEKLRLVDGNQLAELLKKAPDDLASIFFRYKPLFLAMKKNSNQKTFFNQLRKKANRLHKPLPVDYLNSITAQIKGDGVDMVTLKNRLASASIFRKIRLAYALSYRLNPADSIVYRVRNGRAWATEFEWPDSRKVATAGVFSAVVNSIVDDIRENVQGKTIYIPAQIHYAVPATEKQFTGNFPVGSYISVPEDMVMGIHWVDPAAHRRVDLDLSVIGISGKVGWDAWYRTESRDVMFSGDMTAAPPPNGASELFYFGASQAEPTIIVVNYYNHWKGDEIDCKLVVAQDKVTNFSRNYMIDVNKIVASANMHLDKKQTVLGLIVGVAGENRVYLASAGAGDSITVSKNKVTDQTRKFFLSSLVNSLKLREVLELAGANVVSEVPDGEYIDLSPEKLDKTTILDLINPVVMEESDD